MKRLLGKFRFIIKLKPLNSSVRCRHFRLESLYCLLNLLPPNSFFYSLDIKDAHLYVPIPPVNQMLLCFKVRMQDCVLHF